MYGARKQGASDKQSRKRERTADARKLTEDSCGIQGMGFSRAKAKEALEECNFSVDAAVDWLVSNCV